jgi:hypothetical protein
MQSKPWLAPNVQVKVSRADRAEMAWIIRHYAEVDIVSLRVEAADASARM